MTSEGAGNPPMFHGWLQGCERIGGVLHDCLDYDADSLCSAVVNCGGVVDSTGVTRDKSGPRVSGECSRRVHEHQ